MSLGTEDLKMWAIVEVMGHRRMAGLISEQEIAGANFLRIDVPEAGGEGFAITQFYSAAAIYAITPTTEEMARRVASLGAVEPVSRWELQQIPATVGARQGNDGAGGEEDEMPF
jgi:hypothetical protein